MKIVLVPCGSSEWHEQGRVLGRAALSLSVTGRVQVQAWSVVLAEFGLRRLLCGPDELTSVTARLLGGRLGVAGRSDAALEEVDFGLWAGLTDAELRNRFATARRELQDAPLHVQPPQGEPLEQAAARLFEAVRRRLVRGDVSGTGFVLRPWALALVRHRLGGVTETGIWAAREASAPVTMEYDAAPRSAGRRGK